MGRLIDISDDRFWQILFDEACVEGQQADRINDELEEITAYDVEAVVKHIEDASVELYGFAKVVGLNKAIEIVRNGGVK